MKQNKKSSALVRKICVRNISKVFCGAALLLLAACSGSGDLLKMVPNDAAGIIAFDVPELLDETDIYDDGRWQLPPDLSAVIDANEGSQLSVLLTDMPVMGLDLSQKIYVFFPLKTFSAVALAALDDEDAAKKTVAQRIGANFRQINGLDCALSNGAFCVINDDVLFFASVGYNSDIDKLAAAAQPFFDRTATPITANKDIAACLKEKAEINAYVTPTGLRALMSRFAALSDFNDRVPILDLFTESDAQALQFHAFCDDDKVDFTLKVIAPKGGTYDKLLSTLLDKPDPSVLKAMPVSMDYIISTCIKGENLVSLPMVQQLLGMLTKLPKWGTLDAKGILQAVDGTFAVGMAADPHLEGEWNVVLAVETQKPDSILQKVSAFANDLGQAPVIYGGEYVYEAGNKMVRMAAIDNVLYVKALDYEQTEGYADSLAIARDFFSKVVIGAFIQTAAKNVPGYLRIGLTDPFKGFGTFTLDQLGVRSEELGVDPNASLQLLKWLCSIRPASPAGNDAYSVDFDYLP